MEDCIGELSKSSLFTVTNKTIAVLLASSEETQQAVELLGTIVDSKYKIVQLLGAGGMGTVYLARHLMLDKDVALKTFKSASLTDEERLRFQREAQAIAKLSNANIIEVFDFGYVNGEIPYYTMERLVGQSLREKLDNCGFLSVSEAVSVFIQVCRGLSAAHKKGIIHRDLKPDNIFLQSAQPLQSLQSRTTGSNGIQSNALTVKIVDFGIAALAVAPAETQKLTALGTIFGSPLYMSPEQSMGQLVGESSDIYSCGCALFQALTGKPPFVGSNALTTLLMHQSAPIPRLNSLMNGRACPHALEELVTTMLAKSPEDRYQNVDEVLDFLLHIEKMDELGLEDFQEVQDKDAVEKWKKTEGEAEEEEEEEEEEGYNEDDQDESGDHSSRTKFAIAALGTALVSALSIVLITYLCFNSNTKKASIESKTMPINAEPIPRPRHAPSQVPEKFPDETDFPDIQMDKLEKRLASPTYDKRLVVSQFAKLSDKTIELIANTSWIRNLTISRCEFNNKSLGRLKKLNLMRINLEHTKFNDQGAKSLSRCQTLQEIKAQSTDITNAGLKDLSSITGLKILRLGKTIVKADGIRYLCKKNKNCTTIYLIDCRNITSEEIAKLRQEFPQVNFITDINAH